MFKTLKHNKDVIATNIENYIPTDITSVLRINKQKDLSLLTNFLDVDNDIFNKINNIGLTYPLYLINDKENTTLLVRVTLSQETILKETIQHYFSDFPPKRKTYKDIDIYFYPTKNNQFFCCIYHKGVFAGGYNYNLLEQIIDNKDNGSFFEMPKVKSHIEKANNLYNANLYTIYNDSIAIFNILTNKSDLIFEGFSNAQLTTNLSAINIIEDTLDNRDLNYKIFPNELLKFEVNDSNESIISTSIIKHFVKPYYTFYINEGLSEPVYALKHKENKFKVYNHLNDLEVKYSGKKFNINDFIDKKQRVYTASKKLSKDIFEKDSTVTFTFYKDYLIYSESRNSLIEYIRNNGDYVKPDSTYLENVNTIPHNENITGFLDRSKSNSLSNIYNLETLFNGENLYLYGNIAQKGDHVQINLILTK